MAVAVIAVLLLFVTAALSPPTTADYTFTTISVPGSSSTFARGINKNHQVVGQYSVCCPVTIHGFLLSDGTFSTIDVPGTALTVAHGISNASPPHIVGVFR